MRRLVETKIAAVIDRRQALVGAQGIMDAVIAFAARHQRRDHHLRSDRQRLAHEVFSEFRADLDQHATDLVTERERPWQRLRPMAFEDMQIGAADAAGADLYQRRLLRNFRPRHSANDRLRAGTVIGAYANLFHGNFLRPLLLLLLAFRAAQGACQAYVKHSDANLGIALAPRLTGRIAVSAVRPNHRGVKRCAIAGAFLPSCSRSALTMGFQFQSVAAVAPLLGPQFRRASPTSAF